MHTTHRSLLTAHRGLLTAHRGLLTAYRGLGAAHRGLGAAHRDLLTAHRGLGATHRGRLFLFVVLPRRRHPVAHAGLGDHIVRMLPIRLDLAADALYEGPHVVSFFAVLTAPHCL